MSAEAATLRGIFATFRKAVADPEKLIRDLVELKAARLNKIISSDGSLTKGQVMHQLAAALRAIDQVKDHLVKLDPELMPNTPQTSFRLSYPNRSTVQFSRDRTNWLEKGDVTETLEWVPDILECLKQELIGRIANFVHGQNTPENLKTMYLAIAAKYCRTAGIKISASNGSQFYKIAQWFLGAEDPKEAIKKMDRRFLSGE